MTDVNCKILEESQSFFAFCFDSVLKIVYLGGLSLTRNSNLPPNIMSTKVKTRRKQLRKNSFS